MPSADVSRRTLLKISLGITGILGLGVVLKFLGYQPAPATPTRFTLKAPREYAAASATSVPEAKAWLFRDEKGLYVISAVCTHLGCTVNFANDRFECPCHGSQFNKGGYVLKGPARLPLSYLELSFSPEGMVVLDIRQTVASDRRLQVIR